MKLEANKFSLQKISQGRTCTPTKCKYNKQNKKEKQENKIDVGYEVKWHPKIEQHISKMQRKQTKHKRKKIKIKKKKKMRSA
jgi:hypothetical protein